MLWFKKQWMEWEEYKGRIAFLSLFHFQQNTRKQNIRNLQFLNFIFMEVNTMKIIKVEDKTHKRLGEFGNKNETFDDIIKRLLDNAPQK